MSEQTITPTEENLVRLALFYHLVYDHDQLNSTIKKLNSSLEKRKKPELCLEVNSYNTEELEEELCELLNIDHSAFQSEMAEGDNNDREQMSVLLKEVLDELIRKGTSVTISNPS